jgi:hypothetical protein
MVHLHFQVMDRATLDGMRTFPVTFTNIEVNQPYADDFAPEVVFEPGFFVLSSEAPAPAVTPSPGTRR